MLTLLVDSIFQLKQYIEYEPLLRCRCFLLIIVTGSFKGCYLAQSISIAVCVTKLQKFCENTIPLM